MKTSERYIVSGSSVFSPTRKAGAGIEGHTITSAAAKARSKSSRQELPRPHRAAVVGLVVAGREREGAEQDPPLHLGAEARRPALDVQRREVRVGRARAVPHAVEPRQVRGRLGAGDHVVDRDRDRRPRNRDGDDLGAGLAEDPARALRGSRRPRGRGPRASASARKPTRRPSTPRARAASGSPDRAGRRSSSRADRRRRRRGRGAPRPPTDRASAARSGRATRRRRPGRSARRARRSA